MREIEMMIFTFIIVELYEPWTELRKIKAASRMRDREPERYLFVWSVPSEANILRALHRRERAHIFARPALFRRRTTDKLKAKQYVRVSSQWSGVDIAVFHLRDNGGQNKCKEAEFDGMSGWIVFGAGF